MNKILFKHKYIVASNVSLIIVGTIINFPYMVLGDSINTLNVVVSILYLMSWIVLFVIGYFTQNIKLIKYSIGFWSLFSITLIAGLLHILKITTVPYTIIYPIIIIMYSPMYGLNIFHDTDIFLITLTIIHFIFLLLSVIVYKKRFGH